MNPFTVGRFYCGRCGDHRRIILSTDAKFDVLKYTRKGFDHRLTISNSLVGTPAPALFTYQCTQCDAAWSVLIYPSGGNLAMALLPAHLKDGSISTLHAPDGVAYYLSQAARCHGIGANTAAVTMFRSAAEWLLEDQGFKAKMLGPKLAELEAAMKAGTAPKWAGDVDPAYLNIIKDLGNLATHTNSGDLTKQEGLDAELYAHLELTFLELLDLIYEQPVRRASRLAELKKPLVPAAAVAGPPITPKP